MAWLSSVSRWRSAALLALAAIFSGPLGTAANAAAAPVSKSPGGAVPLVLLPDTFPATGNNPQTRPGQYAKPGPWKVCMSHYGLAGSTHTYQTAHEAEYAVTKHKEIGQYLFRSADLNAAKQASDIEDLIAQGCDALIVAALTPTSASAGIEKARARGIPTVVYLGQVSTQAFTTEIQGDDYFFGRVMAQYLIDQAKGHGNIWMLRGVPGHPIDAERYRGAMDAFATAPGIKITATQYAKWRYDDAKKTCQNLYLSRPDVQGVWSSGANMSMGCLDVFKQLRVKAPPITAEASNGWMRLWVKDRLSSIAPICPPGLSAAAIEAAVALLQGKQVYKHYVNRPAPITRATLGRYFRPELSDSYWAPTGMPEAKLREYYGKR